MNKKNRKKKEENNVSTATLCYSGSTIKLGDNNRGGATLCEVVSPLSPLPQSVLYPAREPARREGPHRSVHFSLSSFCPAFWSFFSPPLQRQTQVCAGTLTASLEPSAIFRLSRFGYQRAVCGTKIDRPTLFQSLVKRPLLVRKYTIVLLVYSIILYSVHNIPNTLE